MQCREKALIKLKSLQAKIIALGEDLGGGHAVSLKIGRREYLDHLWNTRIYAYNGRGEENFLKLERLRKLYVEWELLRRVVAEKYIGLVHFIARQYSHRNVEYGDLLQEGAKGLLRAIDCFDARRGVPFEKYAPYWIRRYLSLLVENNSEIIRIPESAVKRRRKMIYGQTNYLFFESLCGKNGDELYAEERESPEEKLVRKNQGRLVLESVEKLSGPQKTILQLRYLGDIPKTLERVGRECGCSREKVRILSTQALEKIRKKVF